jgi:hypothetical protein
MAGPQRVREAQADRDALGRIAAPLEDADEEGRPLASSTKVAPGASSKSSPSPGTAKSAVAPGGAKEPGVLRAADQEAGTEPEAGVDEPPWQAARSASADEATALRWRLRSMKRDLVESCAAADAGGPACGTARMKTLPRSGAPCGFRMPRIALHVGGSAAACWGGMHEDPHTGFPRAFGRRPTHRARAPGRVNLIGEHTDYNGLPVLPMAIQRAVQFVFAAREDARVRLANADSRSTRDASSRSRATSRRSAAAIGPTTCRPRRRSSRGKG